MHLTRHAYQGTRICMYEVILHMATWKKSHERYLVTLQFILTGFLFESLFLMLWIAEEPFSLPDFSHIFLLSFKGTHDEENCSCRLKEILKVDDSRSFPTFRIQTTSWTEWSFISTSSLESNTSLRVLHDVSLAEMMNKPSIVGHFSLITTGCPERKKGKYLSNVMEHRALFAHENQIMASTDAVQRLTLTSLELVLCLNLFLYTSHPNVNPER